MIFLSFIAHILYYYVKVKGLNPRFYVFSLFRFSFVSIGLVDWYSFPMCFEI